MKKKAMICAIVTVLCIASTVALRFAADNTQADYTEVKVTVVSSESKVRKVLGKRQTYYEVMVRYQGEKQELKNTHNAYMYQEGREITAYLCDGELYANVEGVQSSTPMATAYFVFLFASFGLVIVTLTLFGKARKEG